VIDALIATEDRRFYEHRGIDVRRTFGAAFRTLNGDLQGGSTITQQLARNLYPDDIGRATTLHRKVKEALTARKIEKVYSKDEILETYLNTVPFLYNAYGIEMAARTYFDKPAKALDVRESATLVGMLKGTRYYNPVLNPERALQRRNTVLAQMVRSGKLDAAQFETARASPLGLDFERQGETLGEAPHVAQLLRRWLISWADRNGYNIYADGLVVRTTIDSRLQKIANEALARQADKLQALADAAYGPRSRGRKDMLPAFVRESPQYRAALQEGLTDDQALKKLSADAAFLQGLWRDKTRLQAGFLAQEPASGHIKAWVGSRDFREDQFDHVQQARRQPGSTFKPFVYGAAFEQGISPDELLIDAPVEIRVDERTVWKPTDVHDATGQPMTVRDGLVQSKNTITAQLAQQVGTARMAQVAAAMGVRESKLDPVLSLALGTSPVTLKEMVSAYGTIVNSGRYVEPVLVTRIENRKGEVLEAFGPKAPEQGLSTAAAQTLLDVMRGVVDRGTGAAIRSRFALKGDLAGKTGTTQDNTDGWFILMHPKLVGGAWVGFNDNRVTMGDAWGQGAHNALNIVGDFFQQSVKAKAIDPQAKFEAPRDAGRTEPFFGRMNQWFNSVFSSPVESPPAVVGSVPPPAVVLVPPAVEPAPVRGPDVPWSTSPRSAPTDRGWNAQAGVPDRPSLEPLPRVVVRPAAPQADEWPRTGELGGPPERDDRSRETGFRILRQVPQSEAGPRGGY